LVFPKYFIWKHYDLMREFLSDRPIHEPSHVRDTMDAYDPGMYVERNINEGQFEDLDLDLNDDLENHHIPEALRPLRESSQGQS
jgi:hypothetical protein